MKPKMVFDQRTPFVTQLIQTGPDKFKVRYGFQEWEGGYGFAAAKLGEALMHGFACEGKIETKAETSA